MNTPATLPQNLSGLEKETPRPVHLEFDVDVPTLVRRRISYAFGVFAAIYGHRVIDEHPSDIETIVCIYGGNSHAAKTEQTLRIPARYCPYRPSTSPPLQMHRYAGEDFYLAHGVDPETNDPDWLGEIFEWLSSSHELGIRARDSLGRIPYSKTIFAVQGICPRRPHAAMLMSWLEHSLPPRRGSERLPKAPSPVSGVDHLVVSSHDIDFYFVNNASLLARLFKNMAIAITTYKSASFFFSSALLITEVLAGKRVGDYLSELQSLCKQNGITSTIFVVAERFHRRDPNYSLCQLRPKLERAVANGFSVELHGSYQSIVDHSSFESEITRFEAALGARPAGNRQHWLRFDTHDKLFQAVERAKLSYDSSLGFPDMPGFRNGASFAFPPYDFANEQAYPFLEIPVVLMDGSVEAASRKFSQSAQNLSDEILRASRAWGWGGIAVLWHNPIEALSVPKEINRVFWKCVTKRSEHSEEWVSAERFLQLCIKRYQQAGLMKEALGNAAYEDSAKPSRTTA